jgi:hypothetical protein
VLNLDISPRSELDPVNGLAESVPPLRDVVGLRSGRSLTVCLSFDVVVPREEGAVGGRLNP